MSTVIQASTEIGLEDAGGARKQTKDSAANELDRELVARLADQARTEAVELVENGLLGWLMSGRSKGLSGCSSDTEHPFQLERPFSG
ncbi:hypothetical protein ACTMTF_00040 [Nonomuraea sp. ZG12]|uniref:hypothetical protein n=1 Tax=Nonomuraea sp. ZG12 TaxID=3452207 RepID=UPI003F886DC7